MCESCKPLKNVEDNMRHHCSISGLKGTAQILSNEQTNHAAVLQCFRVTVDSAPFLVPFEPLPRSCDFPFASSK